MSKKKKSNKKQRVAFRKNRQKPARHNKLNAEILDDELATDDLVYDERLSGKGDITRHRTIMSDDEGDQLHCNINEAKCLQGRVIRATGLNSIVQIDDTRRYECTVRRVVRTLQREQRNAVVAGDQVLFLPTSDEQGVIEKVLPRKGVVSRKTRRQEQIIVSNIDQVIIVVSANDPPLKPSLIDRFLISAEKGQVRSIICINKIDLVDHAQLQPIVGLYSRLGYEVLLTCATSQQGIVRLRSLLKSKETAFAGQSGVGKTSLLNAIQPGLKLTTNTISEGTGKGKHTTRRAELLSLDFSGWVVDTPGIRQFGLWDVIPAEVEGFFVEFRPFVPFCKFPDCTHTHEISCAIKQAVDDGMISFERYESYLKIFTGDFD